MQTQLEAFEENEDLFKFYYNKIDGYQKVITQVINPFLPWVFLIVLINRKNLKKPINLLLIFHCIFRFIGLALLNTENVRINRNDNPFLIYPYTEENWKISYAVANIFWTLGELCADWYPLFRTKAVTKNNPKKIRPVIATCLIYNIAKIYTMISFFLNPYVIFDNIATITENDIAVLSSYKSKWWINVAIVQTTSFIYDLSILLTLRKCLFNKLKEFKDFNSGNSRFLRKFKQISEYRIAFSMVASLIFLPLNLAFIYLCFHKCLKNNERCDMEADFALENLRQDVINLNCNLMYIDQILLRFVVKDGYSKSFKKLSSIKNIPNLPSVKTFQSIQNLPSTNNNLSSKNNMSSVNTLYSNNNIASSVNTLYSNNNLPSVNNNLSSSNNNLTSVKINLSSKSNLLPNNNILSNKNTIQFSTNKDNAPPNKQFSSKDISSVTNISSSSSISSVTNLSTTTELTSDTNFSSTTNLSTVNKISLPRHLSSPNGYNKISINI